MAKIAAITCRTLQEEWCPARHQDEAASAAVLAKCLSARTENSARSSRACRLRTQSESRSSGSRELAQTLILSLNRAHSQTTVRLEFDNSKRPRERRRHRIPVSLRLST